LTSFAIVCADGSKFGRQGLIRVCGPDTVHMLVTDQRLDARFVEGLSLSDVEMCIAE
jgi:DeoR/GlpR family transcriptional regulator of sugar metabolism